jgi:hypothetical protein
MWRFLVQIEEQPCLFFGMNHKSLLKEKNEIINIEMYSSDY